MAEPFRFHRACHLASMCRLRIGLIPLCLALYSGSVVAQIVHPQQPMPTFEVATIKPWKPSQPPPSADGSPGSVKKVVKMAPAGVPPLSTHVHLIGQVELLIEAAYNLPVSSDNRILGGPAWMRSEGERYDLSAKIDDARFTEMQQLSSAQQQSQIALMEQSLLADRLGLKVHFEKREMPVYTLVSGRTGPKLSETSGGGQSQLFVAAGANGESELSAKAITMDDLVQSPFLRRIGRPVTNQTGLTGRYDFHLKWSYDDLTPAQGDGEVPGLSMALQEQLGLKLVPSKAAVEVIVIDHLDRPSEN